jgi:antitoxin component of MazEF toxin-antitoxin module
MMTVRLKTIGGSLMAIIPADIVHKAGLKKGQSVNVAYARGKIVIEPAVKPDWASFFAREIDPEVAGWEFKREEFEDRDVFDLKGDRKKQVANR